MGAMDVVALLASYTRSVLSRRPLMETMTPLSRKVSDTLTAWSKPAGVIAQIKHDTLDAASILGFFFCRLEGVAQLFGGALETA